MPRGSIRTFVAERDGQIVAGLIGVVEDDTLRIWEGRYRPPTPEPGANEYLTWQTALWAHATGKTRLDMLGANTPQLVDFKGKFNPQLHTYFMVERTAFLTSTGALLRNILEAQGGRQPDRSA